MTTVSFLILGIVALISFVALGIIYWEEHKYKEQVRKVKEVEEALFKNSKFKL